MCMIAANIFSKLLLSIAEHSVHVWRWVWARQWKLVYKRLFVSNLNDVLWVWPLGAAAGCWLECNYLHVNSWVAAASSQQPGTADAASRLGTKQGSCTQLYIHILLFIFNLYYPLRGGTLLTNWTNHIQNIKIWNHIKWKVGDNNFEKMKTYHITLYIQQK